MSGTSIVLIGCGLICLALSGALMFRMMPREGRAPSRRMETDVSETGMALTQFILLVAGLALIAKAFF